MVNKRGKGGEEREMEATGPSTFKALYFPPDFFFSAKVLLKRGRILVTKNRTFIFFLALMGYAEIRKKNPESV